jgi:DNA-binding beta-propeller fold protein YncE
MSPDDRQLYIAAPDEDSVITLSRSALDGALTQPPGPAGCTSRSGLRQCRRGRCIGRAAGVAVAPDGAWVYVVSLDARDGAVARFARRDHGGTLVQPRDPRGCISSSLPTRFCTRGRALQGGEDAVVSPDGRNLYVAGVLRGIAGFARDRATGALAQLAGSEGCASTQTSSACQPTRGILTSDHTRLAISSDGGTLYVTSGFLSAGTIAVLRRDPSTGRLRELPGRAGCLESNREVRLSPASYVGLMGSREDCAHLRGLGAVAAIVLAPEGRHAYVLGGAPEDAIATLAIHRPHPVAAVRHGPRRSPSG